MTITYFGQSCFLIETQGKSLLFDPMISSNPLALSVDISSIKPDYILLSHGHEDHCADVETIAKASNATLISNFEIVSWFSKKHISGHPMNTGGKFQFDFGWVKYVHAVHSSSMPDGAYGGTAGGFVIWNSEGCFYFAGDTALYSDMALIPKTCPKLDFAILPIGDNFTMGYQDASIASEYIECDQIIGCHFDTFAPIKINHQKAKEAFKRKRKTLVLPQIGKSFDL